METQPQELAVKETEQETLPRVAVLSKIAQDSKASFKRTAKAKDYISSRNLDPEEMKVGYIGQNFGSGWNRQLKDSGLKIGILKESRQNTVVPKFKNCVLFFTKNEKGQVIDIYGRSIASTGINGDAKHFYLNGKHQGIFPKYPSRETKKLIITEAIIDAATLQQQPAIKEKYEVLSLFGINGLTEEIRAAIKALPELEEIILFFDGDKSGKDAAKKIAAKIRKDKECLVSTVETPENEDINSLTQGHDPEILQHLIENRQLFSRPTVEDVPSLTEKAEEEVAAKPTKVQSESPPQQLNTSKSQHLNSSTAPHLNTSNPEKLTYTTNGQQFIIWGGVETDNIHRLRLNLLVHPIDNKQLFYQDDVNLYSNGQLKRYIRGAAEELEISTTTLKTTIGNLKFKLEAYRLKLMEQRREALKPKIYRMSKEEEMEAMQFLKTEGLVKNTLKAIQKTGLVGEEKNGLLLFFLYLSRMMDEPLHAIVFGKSGSGKTYLQTRISECLPEESVRTITSLTENTLYYSPPGFWEHKLLLIEDLEGVYNAFLPLREFMSKQSIIKLTTEKDAKGKNDQRALKVDGPICVSGATTSSSIYEDNANRSFLIHIDETMEHARKVMDYQRRLQAGMINEKEQQQYKQLLKNTQRLLKKIRVINPYATMLDIPDSVFKKLRTNMHYLRLIEVITFFNQYQREVKKDSNGKPYIETTPEDIEWANYLIKDSLLRKSDELSGQVRQFFEMLKSYADKKEDTKTFYAKEIREAFRMNPMTTNRYLRELESRGLLQRNGGNRKTGFEYEIKAWDEYEKLKSGIDILDEILEKVKAKYAALSEVEV